MKIGVARATLGYTLATPLSGNTNRQKLSSYPAVPVDFPVRKYYLDPPSEAIAPDRDVRIRSLIQ